MIHMKTASRQSRQSALRALFPFAVLAAALCGAPAAAEQAAATSPEFPFDAAAAVLPPLSPTLVVSPSAAIAYAPYYAPIKPEAAKSVRLSVYPAGDPLNGSNPLYNKILYTGAADGAVALNSVSPNLTPGVPYVLKLEFFGSESLPISPVGTLTKTIVTNNCATLPGLLAEGPKNLNKKLGYWHKECGNWHDAGEAAVKAKISAAPGGEALLICHEHLGSIHQAWVRELAKKSENKYAAVLAVDWGYGPGDLGHESAMMIIDAILAVESACEAGAKELFKELFKELLKGLSIDALREKFGLSSRGLMDPLSSAAAINPAAEWSFGELRASGIAPEKLTIVGYGHGAHLGKAIAYYAKRDSGLVKRLVSLEASPSWSVGFSTFGLGNEASGVEFYKTSWGMSMGVEHSEYGAVFGSPAFFVTAENCFWDDGYRPDTSTSFPWWGGITEHFFGKGITAAVSHGQSYAYSTALAKNASAPSW
jgi:hypothetical protein